MFAVLQCSSIPDHARGYISRFLQQATTNLYVGVLTPRVVDELWQRLVNSIEDGSMCLITSSTASETGFDIKTHNASKFGVIDLDGISMPYIKP